MENSAVSISSKAPLLIGGGDNILVKLVWNKNHCSFKGISIFLHISNISVARKTKNHSSTVYSLHFVCSFDTEIFHENGEQNVFYKYQGYWNNLALKNQEH